MAQTADTAQQISPEKRHDLDSKRRRALKKGSMGSARDILESHVLPNGAGVVLTRYYRSATDQPLQAHFYRPRQVNQGFATEELHSAHERAALPMRLRDLIAKADADKVAPHDLTPGEIICDDWGATMRRPVFYLIQAVPHPRKVRIIRLMPRLVSGNWQDGKVEPVQPLAPDEGAVAFEAAVSMLGGQARLDLGALSRATRWNGKPATIMSD